jgi:hypothetical protein
MVVMIYQIKVQGCLDPNWSDWFNEMEITNDTKTDSHSITIFEGVVEDQATLRGILNHIWDLNLTILSVIRGETE